MKNIFIIGTQVTGKSFIGRDKYIKDFRKVYFKKKDKTIRAIVGLTRMGKSSLIFNIFKNRPEDFIYINMDLGLCDNYFSLWKKICRKIYDYLKTNDLMTEILEENLAISKENNIEWENFVDSIKIIFQNLYKLKIKTIIVLDEFDYAMNLFKETKHWHLFRTIFSEPQYNVSAITISRRSLQIIEGDLPRSSTFHGIFDTIYFEGFDDDDMKKYYKVFEDRKITLDEKQREEIEYYCGRLPFLLSIMGHYIIDAFEHKEKIDIRNIFLNKCKTINNYYKNDCIEHLKRENDLQRLIPFVFGPNIGVKKSDKEELINLGYLKESKGKFIAISKYFTNFLSVNEDNFDIWKNIITLEKKIKNIIYNEIIAIINFLHIKGNDINEIQNGILEKINGITNSDISRYQSFINGNFRDFNRNSSFFDVMSLTDSFKIIRYCWQIFSRYFNNETYDKWEMKFDRCAKARNPVAHGHEEYLSESDVNEIDIYCKQIFELLANINSSPVSEQEILQVASQYVNIHYYNSTNTTNSSSTTNTNKSITNVTNSNLTTNANKSITNTTNSSSTTNANKSITNVTNSNLTTNANKHKVKVQLRALYDLVDLNADFEVKSVGSAGTNLLGIVKTKVDAITYMYPATIRKNTLKNIENLQDLVGKVVKVKIVDINQQGDRYLCNYLGEA